MDLKSNAEEKLSPPGKIVEALTADTQANDVRKACLQRFSVWGRKPSRINGYLLYRAK